MLLTSVVMAPFIGVLIIHLELIILIDFMHRSGVCVIGSLFVSLPENDCACRGYFSCLSRSTMLGGDPFWPKITFVREKDAVALHHYHLLTLTPLTDHQTCANPYKTYHYTHIRIYREIETPALSRRHIDNKRQCGMGDRMGASVWVNENDPKLHSSWSSNNAGKHTQVNQVG